jgi:hypothetical protein
MNRHFYCSLLILLIAAFTVTGISASEEVVEFSANAYQKGPQTPPIEAKMFVAGKRVRKEYSANGQQVVEIYDAGKQHAVLLMPAKRSYLERQGSTSNFIEQNSKPKNPCQGIKEASCKKLGEEKIHGRIADKWEMVMKKDGQDMRALYWIDRQRTMMLKQKLPDGTETELRLQGKETVNGRQTEKWEMTASNPQGQTMRSMQWYDPELKISIREEMPGGYLRELKNISVGVQADSLFEIPAGYTLIKQPPGDAMPPPSVAPAR